MWKLKQQKFIVLSLWRLEVQDRGIGKEYLDTHTHTHTERCEDESRDQGDASKGQVMPKIATKSTEAWGETWNTVPLTWLRRNNPTNPLVSDLQPLEL